MKKPAKKTAKKKTFKPFVFQRVTVQNLNDKYANKGGSYIIDELGRRMPVKAAFEPAPKASPCATGCAASAKTDATGIDATLAERGARYGDFTGHAYITQSIKDVMATAPKWPELKPIHKEALDMIAHKIGRILNGDPDYADSWHDIAGYAKLVEERIGKK